MEEESFKKILIVGNRLIGDSIDSLHALHSFIEVYSRLETKFYFLGYSYSAFVYESVFTGKHSFEKRFYIDVEGGSEGQRSYPKTQGALLPLLAMRRKLAAHKFDLAIIYPGGFIFAFLAFLSGISCKVGFRGDWRSVFLDRHVANSRKLANYKNFFALNTLFQKPIPQKTFTFPVDIPKEKSFFQQFLLEERKYLVLAPCASEASRVWAGENFAKLALELARKYKVTVVWLGMENEYDYISKISEQNGLNLAGRLNWQEVIAILSQTRFFVGNDSGLAHLAAMFVPSFVICGPSNVSLASPLGKHVHMIFDEKTLPSHWRKKKRYAKQLDINNLSVDRILHVIHRGLAAPIRNLKKIKDKQMAKFPAKE